METKQINYIESLVLDFYNVYQDIMKWEGNHRQYIPELYEEHITNQSPYEFSYEEFADLVKGVSSITMKYGHE